MYAVVQNISKYLLIIHYITNSPYDGKWSKTMAGFGPEDDHFVVELTYNYGIKQYQLGNDFQVSTHFKKIMVS